MRRLHQVSRQFPCEPSSCLPTVFAAKKQLKHTVREKSLFFVGGSLGTVHTFTCTHTFSPYCISAKALGKRLLKSILDTEDY